jgi:hypothetical protein
MKSNAICKAIPFEAASAGYLPEPVVLWWPVVEAVAAVWAVVGWTKVERWAT